MKSCRADHCHVATLTEDFDLVRLHKQLQQHSYVVVPRFLSDHEVATLRQVVVLAVAAVAVGSLDKSSVSRNVIPL